MKPSNWEDFLKLSWSLKFYWCFQGVLKENVGQKWNILDINGMCDKYFGTKYCIQVNFFVRRAQNSLISAWKFEDSYI